MQNKVCFKCSLPKPLSAYYPHPAMGDGYLNKCKDCTKADVRRSYLTKATNAEWVENERSRHRDKYYRLNYVDKHKPTTEAKRVIIKRYINKYPEKHRAVTAVRLRFGKQESGNHLHHWSYNEQHFLDTITLLPKDHLKAHRFITYDQAAKMYRRKDNGALLDTKEQHLTFIKYCIANKD